MLGIRSMSAKSAAPARRSPLLALWSRDDPRTAVNDFLPTKTIAVLPIVAKPLRDAQSRLLITAIRRRGKTDIPSPPTTQALLDALVIGEPHYFGEKWEHGYSPQWRLVCDEGTALARLSSVESSPDGGYFLEMQGPGTVHRGFVRSLQAPNLLVRRLRVTMSYSELLENYDPHNDDNEPGGAVGYVMLCGPGASYSALSDFLGGPRFTSEGDGVVSLAWLHYVRGGDNEDHMLVEGVTPNTRYVVDATFNHESVTDPSGTVDISVNGQTVAGGIPVVYSPLSSIHLYNWSCGRSGIGDIEIWSERAALAQTWKSDLGPE